MLSFVLISFILRHLYYQATKKCLSHYNKCVHTRNAHSSLHQLSHRTHLSIHPSTSHPHGSSRTLAFPAGHWCHYEYHRATERAHGESWCLADWFLICGEEMVHLRHWLHSIQKVTAAAGYFFMQKTEIRWKSTVAVICLTLYTGYNSKC